MAVGVLAKESVIFVLPLAYSLRARSPWDAEVARRAALLALPAIAVVVGIRIAVPQWNANPAYVASLAEPIRRNARTIPSYTPGAVLRTIMGKRLADWPSSILQTVSAFGLLVGALAVIGILRGRSILLRFSPFLTLVSAQLVFALNTQRLLALAFPVVILLALHGSSAMVERFGVASWRIVLLATAFFGLQLVWPREWEPNILVQLATVAAIVPILLVGRRTSVEDQISRTTYTT